MTEKVTLLIPIAYNDGSRVAQAVFEEIYSQLFILSGGWTIEGEVVGAYRMRSGERKVDKSVKISVVVESQLLPELRRLVQAFAVQLGQESMYFERTSSEVEFIRPVRGRSVSQRRNPRRKRK